MCTNLQQHWLLSVSEASKHLSPSHTSNLMVDTQWKALKGGKYFFTCDKGAEGVGTHCNYGQKLAIAVLISGSSAPVTSPPAISPTPLTSSPSPHVGIPPVSTPKSSPLPGPSVAKAPVSPVSAPSLSPKMAPTFSPALSSPGPAPSPSFFPSLSPTASVPTPPVLTPSLSPGTSASAPGQPVVPGGGPTASTAPSPVIVLHSGLVFDGLHSGFLTFRFSDVYMYGIIPDSVYGSMSIRGSLNLQVYCSALIREISGAGFSVI